MPISKDKSGIPQIWKKRCKVLVPHRLLVGKHCSQTDLHDCPCLEARRQVGFQVLKDCTGKEAKRLCPEPPGYFSIHFQAAAGASLRVRRCCWSPWRVRISWGNHVWWEWGPETQASYDHAFGWSSSNLGKCNQGLWKGEIKTWFRCCTLQATFECQVSWQSLPWTYRDKINCHNYKISVCLRAGTMPG